MRYTSICILLLACSAQAGTFKTQAPGTFKTQASILVDKSDRTLTYDGRTYKVVIGKNPEGHKVKQGDKKTPEGKYWATRRECPKCNFKRAYVINYPNRKDRTEGRTGGGILIHNGVGPFYWWTAGCVALSNEDFDRLWKVLPRMVEVEIVP